MAKHRWTDIAPRLEEKKQTKETSQKRMLNYLPLTHQKTVKHLEQKGKNIG